MKLSKIRILYIISGTLLTYSLVALLLLPEIAYYYAWSIQAIDRALFSIPVCFTIGLVLRSVGKKLWKQEKKNALYRDLYQLMVDDGWTLITEEALPPEVRAVPHRLPPENADTNEKTISFGSKHVDGIPLFLIVKEARYEDKRSNVHLFFEITTVLPATVGGWLDLQPKVLPTPSIQLESVEMNRKINIRGNPKQLTYDLLPPNVLTWYVDLSHQLRIHLNNQCLIVFTFHDPAEGNKVLLQKIQDACADAVTVAKPIRDILTNEA